MVNGKVVAEDTTQCQGTFRESNASTAGVHHVSAAVEAMAGASGTGTRSVDIVVTR